MRVLMVGDIVGKTGRRMVVQHVRALREAEGIDFVVANGENAAGGNGLTHDVMDELLSAGIDVITSGNHIFDKKEVFQFIDDVPQLLRPINLPSGTPGHGYVVRSCQGVPVAVVNVSGRAFMPFQYDDPFRAIDHVLESLSGEVTVVLVDFHAETTSEKAAFAWYLDGRVTAVVGTHTHVPTADERILPQGTAFLTDLGMTGPMDSVIGVKTDLVVQRMLTQRPVRFETAVGRGQFGALLIDIDDGTGKALAIKRFLIRE
ncbi:TIGR00282 family metallophosphoesterase [Sulfobacillus harzensis]|uniref:TIGR00282 family metallophosphoesterase n=1 Tax=Sulfobacillus harzensis TaxID=2729629 RepID=A0A7Y0L1W9_9FIRM|nr:TIGR00282 family metallophosphoesterase [Sulfobacillus harzensis]NMP20820.1 TIGR00282 family metallophosphoesterase [Sulfobacillus harzensis]